MRLKNKLTGEINIIKVDEDYFNIYQEDGDFVCPVTLKELNDGWEDAPEEPKGYWSYDTFDNDVTFNRIANEDDRKADQEIGNYFNTREEAEKTVEKLKAYKRLKDNNFRFCGWVVDHQKKCGKAIFKATDCTVTMNEARQFYRDLDLLFGGEE